MIETQGDVYTLPVSGCGFVGLEARGCLRVLAWGEEGAVGTHPGCADGPDGPPTMLRDTVTPKPTLRETGGAQPHAENVQLLHPCDSGGGL